MKSWRPELRALLLGALFLLLGLFAGGAARAAEPPPLASFFTRPGLQAARLSPDGAAWPSWPHRAMRARRSTCLT
jgi:hypothetical protein